MTNTVWSPTRRRLTLRRVGLRAVLDCAESNVSNFKFENLRENEFLRKIILTCLSGAQMGSIHEKNRGRKSRDTAPLKLASKIDL